jgi:hypothetical protein
MSVDLQKLLEVDFKRILFESTRQQKGTEQSNEDKTYSVIIDREVDANKSY